jgi:hypothetical protein
MTRTDCRKISHGVYPEYSRRLRDDSCVRLIVISSECEKSFSRLFSICGERKLMDHFVVNLFFVRSASFLPFIDIDFPTFRFR